MIWKILWGLVFLVCAATIVVAFLFGREVPFAEQWPLFEALRATASIIFAVVGAWLAIIYPERLKLSFRNDAAKSSSQANGIGQLLSPAVHSTAILSIVLVVGVAAPLLKKLEILFPYQAELRGVSYALAVFLTQWQLWTVILTLIPADKIKLHDDSQVRFRKTVIGYKRIGKKANESPRTH